MPGGFVTERCLLDLKKETFVDKFYRDANSIFQKIFWRHPTSVCICWKRTFFDLKVCDIFLEPINGISRLYIPIFQNVVTSTHWKGDVICKM